MSQVIVNLNGTDTTNKDEPQKLLIEMSGDVKEVTVAAEKKPHCCDQELGKRKENMFLWKQIFSRPLVSNFNN